MRTYSRRYRYVEVFGGTYMIKKEYKNLIVLKKEELKRILGNSDNRKIKKKNLKGI